MNAANELRRSISFNDVDLHFPKPQQKYKIIVRKYNDKNEPDNITGTHTILITSVQLTTFNFRFINKSQYKHELKAELFFGNLNTPNNIWQPPCWAVLPFRDDKFTRILESVSWAPQYSERFNKLYVKKRFKHFLLQRHHDLSGKQKVLNF